MAGPPQPVRRRRRKTLQIGDKGAEEGDLVRRQSESLSSSVSSTDVSDNMSDFDVHLDRGSQAETELDAMTSLGWSTDGEGGDGTGRPRRRSLLKRAQDELFAAITGWLDEPSVNTEMCSLDIFLPRIPTG